jgi:hypothetical protein
MNGKRQHFKEEKKLSVLVASVSERRVVSGTTFNGWLAKTLAEKALRCAP